MEEITIKKQLTEDDYNKYSAVLTQKIYKKLGSLFIVGVILAASAIAIINNITTQFFENTDSFIPSIIWGLCILILPYFTCKYLWKHGDIKYTDPKGYFQSQKEFTIGAIGIKEYSDNYETTAKWDAIIEIIETKYQILFCIDKMAALVIPKHAFTSPEDADIFLKQAHEFWESAKNKDTPTVTSKNPWKTAPPETLGSSVEEPQ